VWFTPEEALGISDFERAFGELGLIKSRTRAMLAVAELIVDGCLSFGSEVNPIKFMDTLCSKKALALGLLATLLCALLDLRMHF
jgi:hypothetical protein